MRLRARSPCGRKSQSELKLASPQGRARTVNVEVRSKRTYVKREVLEDQARHQQEEIDRQRENRGAGPGRARTRGKGAARKGNAWIASGSRKKSRRRTDEEVRKRTAEEEARRLAEIQAREVAERERKPPPRSPARRRVKLWTTRPLAMAVRSCTSSAM